jgi:GTP cyclohydrolase I
VRKRAWQGREIPLKAETWPLIVDDHEPTAQQSVETTDTLAALRQAIEGDLSPHQREVLVAIALNGVPIDVLAERLNTTRGALYRTLHDGRGKLRAALLARDLGIHGHEGRKPAGSQPPATETADRGLTGPHGPELSCDECFEQLDRTSSLSSPDSDAGAADPSKESAPEGCSACAEDHDSLEGGTVGGKTRGQRDAKEDMNTISAAAEPDRPREATDPGRRRPGSGARRALDRAAVERAACDLLVALGADLETEGLRDTPRRMAAAYAELLTPEPFSLTTFLNDEGYDELVVVRDIPFQSLCMHHVLPFHGVAHVAYLPAERILGLSKLARVVELFARDLQLQERLTTQIAGWLQAQLEPKGVGVVLEAEHLCMSLRGVQKPGAKTVTSALHGLVRDDPRTRAEFLSLTGRRTQ